MEMPIDDTILNDDDWLAWLNLDFDGSPQPDSNHCSDNTFAGAFTSSDQVFDFTPDVISAPTIDPTYQNLFDVEGSMIATTAIEDVASDRVFDFAPDIFSAPTVDPHSQSLFDVDGSIIGTTAIEGMALLESTAPNNDRPEVDHDDLAEKCESVLQAVERNNKRKALHADTDNNNNKKYTTRPKFRIELPGKVGKTDALKPKHKRLKGSEQRACLLCRFFKRKCSPGQNCARCLEKGLGQRDLAYTYCLRDNPVRFNPFSVETQHSSISDFINVKAVLPILAVFVDEHHATKSSSDTDLMIICSHIGALRSGYVIHTRKHLLNPDVAQYLEIAQSSVSAVIFERLEEGLRSTNLDQYEAKRHLLRRLSLAIYLYSWLYYPQVARNSVSNAEAEFFCKKYLREYIYLLLTKSGASNFSRNITPQDFIESEETGLANELLDYLMYPYTLMVPKIELKIIRHATEGAYELARAMYRAVLLKASTISDCVGLRAPMPIKSLGDWPQSANLMLVLSIWSLFWQRTPLYLRRCLCYTEIQFLSPLVCYVCGDRMPSSPKLFSERSWLQWQEDAETYQDFLHSWMIRALGSNVLRTNDQNVLKNVLFVRQVPYVHEEILALSNETISLQLNGAIRWTILFSLERIGLINVESILDFLEEMWTAADTSPYEYLSAGFDLFLKTAEFKKVLFSSTKLGKIATSTTLHKHI